MIKYRFEYYVLWKDGTWTRESVTLEILELDNGFGDRARTLLWERLDHEKLLVIGPLYWVYHVTGEEVTLE